MINHFSMVRRMFGGKEIQVFHFSEYETKILLRVITRCAGSGMRHMGTNNRKT
jgi:hypothetical protein